MDDTTADVTVEMGKTNQLGAGEAILGGRPFAGLAIDVGNPHLACVDPDLPSMNWRRSTSARRFRSTAGSSPKG